MNNKIYFKIILPLLFVIGFGFGFYARTLARDPEASIPKPLESVISFLYQRAQEFDEDVIYHKVDLTDFIKNGTTETKAYTEGVVGAVHHEPDGDYHVLIKNEAGQSLVVEFIPQINLAAPKEGDHIGIWGISHFDYSHQWWEIHPVTGWKVLP